MTSQNQGHGQPGDPHSGNEHPEHPEHPEPSLVAFTVENNNEGGEVDLTAKPSDDIQDVINALYAELGRTKMPGDRLTRVSDGSNVFAAASEKVGAYAGADHHEQPIRWSFVAETGGARR